MFAALLTLALFGFGHGPVSTDIGFDAIQERWVLDIPEYLLPHMTVTYSVDPHQAVWLEMMGCDRHDFRDEGQSLLAARKGGAFRAVILGSRSVVPEVRSRCEALLIGLGRCPNCLGTGRCPAVLPHVTSWVDADSECGACGYRGPAPAVGHECLRCDGLGWNGRQQ